MKDIINKLKSVKLCMQAHPDNEPDSEFADRISDLNTVINKLEAPKDYKQSAMPMIKYLNENHNLHTKAIISCTSVDIIQEIKGQGNIYDYLN